MGFAAGGLVVAVEHRPDGTRTGREFTGRVEHVGPDRTDEVYVLVRYDDPSVLGTGCDTYYDESGWRSWDGEMRWRIVPLRPDHELGPDYPNAPA